MKGQSVLLKAPLHFLEAASFGTCFGKFSWCAISTGVVKQGAQWNVIHLFHSYFQVVIVGNGAVGKSSMIQRYCKGIFTRNYKKTIGVDFLEKHIT